EADVIDINALKAARLINRNIQRVKVIRSGKLEKAVTVKGLMLTKGAKEAIEAAGGKIED
ncbi:MAG: uL15 family ribosomal protein, partial [Proteobacteria bacterium]|nr:uL15 family ribosomal protein [Pseudomonadota bacterium]